MHQRRYLSAVRRTLIVGCLGKLQLADRAELIPHGNVKLVANQSQTFVDGGASGGEGREDGRVFCTRLQFTFSRGAMS